MGPSRGRRDRPALSALVVGATGLIGGHLLHALAEEPMYATVRAVVRRPLPPELRLPGVEERIIDFERLQDHAADLAGDHVFCALGTTRRQAGSKERFRESAVSRSESRRARSSAGKSPIPEKMRKIGRPRM